MALEHKKSVLDRDGMNKYRPDGEHVICKIEATSYKIDTVPESHYGSFMVEDDGTLVYFADVAFKMLFDLSVKARLGCVKYIVAEFDRANKRYHNGDYMFTRPSGKRPLGALLKQHGIKSIALPNDEKIIPSNLRILSEYDLIGNMRPNGVTELLLEYIYMGKGPKTMFVLHKAITELFCTMSGDEINDFVNRFYSQIDNVDAVEPSAQEPISVDTPKKPEDIVDNDDTQSLGATVADDEKSILDDGKDSKEDASGDESEYLENSDDKTASELPEYMPNLAKVSVSDITGLDETYGTGYCEGLYDKKLQETDSEGFLEQTIAARANGSAAPIDLLALTNLIKRENEMYTPASKLKEKIDEISEDIKNASGGNVQGLGDDGHRDSVPAQNSDAPDDSDIPDEGNVPPVISENDGIGNNNA